MVVGDEVEQVYVSADHRGAGSPTPPPRGGAPGRCGRSRNGVAGRRRREHRARRFYERNGWADGGCSTIRRPAEQGPIRVPAHRYIKDV